MPINRSYAEICPAASDSSYAHRPQQQGALPERGVAMLVYEVLRVVRCCHAAGILHGDIKVRVLALRLVCP